MLAILPPMTGIHASRTWLRNPDTASWPLADDWLLETFKKFIATDQTIRLDSYLVPGVAMIAPARAFAVANMALESTAGLQVPEMNVSFRLAEPLRNGDELRLIAPPGALRPAPRCT